MAGVVPRPTYWGGVESDLLRATNHCRYYFMGATRAWATDDVQAQAVYAFLASLPAEAPAAQPFTIPRTARDLPPGDPGRGAEVFDAACRACHGSARSGEGRLRDAIPVLPDESVRYFASLGFDRTQTRVTFIEKVRHGPFLGLYGTMPPFSVEALSDADLASLVTFLELY